MARPFRFSLERVLDYRIQLEEQAKLALAKAQHAYTRQSDFVQSLRALLDEHEAKLHSDENLTPQAMWLWRNYKERLLQDLAQAEALLLTLARELNTRRREAVERSKDKKLLEKLKENQAARHALDEQTREQNEYDEMATLRYQPRSF
ncbi:MAG: flagellar export protein FliJ [Desulfovibrio sp.]|nr:MAG: flagellar export protein FliJ [Desulfovibrio sp.]